jgi:hypothetical protein
VDVGASQSNTNFQAVAVCAQKPQGYKLVTKTIDDPAGAVVGGTVKCPTGSVILSGGLASTSDMSSVYELEAAPTGNRGYHGVQTNGSTLDQPFHLYALCAAKPLGYARVTTTISVGAGSTMESRAICPTGTVAIGGGVLLSPLTPAAFPNVSSPFLDPSMEKSWESFIDNGSASTDLLTTAVICAA